MSKRQAIGVLYVIFGGILVASSLPTRPIGVGLGVPFLAVGIRALRPARWSQ